MRTFFGILIIIVGILLGLWLGVWICFIGGIVQVIHSCQMQPIDALHLALGIARIFGAALVGWPTIFICSVFGITVLSGRKSARKKYYWKYNFKDN